MRCATRKCESALTKALDKDKNMHEMHRNEGLPCLESLSRRSLIKGIAGLSATLATSSLPPAIAAQTQDHHPATPGPQVSPVQSGRGPFTPSNGAGRYLQLFYPPSTTKGELQLGAI